MILLIMFMTFLVCSMTAFKSVILRIIVNIAIEALVLVLLYTKGADLGVDAVTRGEILYQHIQKGENVTQNERRIPYHPFKGFVVGVCGSVLLLICAVLLAFTAEKQMTGAGVLPSWTDAFMRRSEISGGLVQYSQADSISFTDIIRIVVRIMLMPFVSMAGSESRDFLLTLERCSPLLVLLPAFSYGTGYLQGPARRRQIHTEIAENARRRTARERKARKAKLNINRTKGPQQLN